jgi:uncharacterized protein GlcG (DUF336 family)
MDISYKGIALFALIIPLSLTANSAQQTASKAQARHPANTSEQIVLTVSVIDKKGNFVAGLSRDTSIFSSMRCLQGSSILRVKIRRSVLEYSLTRQVQ